MTGAASSPEQRQPVVDCRALEAIAYELVLSSDALDEMECSCYEIVPCDACRFQTAFAQLKTVLLAAAATARPEVEG